MSYLTRLLSIPLLLALLWIGSSCTDAAYSVGISDGYYDDDRYYYGASRLPLDYFAYDSYYDGLWYRDYVCYDDYWYYQGYDTPYYYDYDPYWW